MARFSYQSISSGGGSLSGTIDAVDRSDVIRLLRQRGEVATRVNQLGDDDASTPESSPARSNGRSTERAAPAGRARGTMSRTELAGFIREVATALEAGLPLLNALRAVLRQATSTRQAAVLDHLIDRIEAGRSLAQAAAEWGRPFDDMVVGMIRAGEASGKLDVVMLQLADLLDRDAETKRSVMAALVYPAILTIVLTAGIIVIVTFIVPRIMATIATTGTALPLPTRVVKGAADFMTAYWYFVAAGIFIAVMAWKTMMSTPQYRLKFDRFVLSIPVVGGMLRDVAVARFTRTLGTLLGSGITVLDALVITRDTLGNRAMEQVIDQVAEKVRSGKSIAEPMERSGYFPPLLVQIISLGERSGRLDEMLSHAATAFDRKTSASIKMFTAVLPPVIVVIMALVVGFILAAVLMPLVEMQSSIG